MPQQGTKPASITVDFTGVERGSGGQKGAHVPEGDYIVKVMDYSHRYKKEDGVEQKDRPYLNWKLQIVSPEEFKGKTIYFTTSLVPESLWNLRGMLEDVGLKVPNSAVAIPLPKLIGKELGVTLADGEPYNGSIKSEVKATFNKNDLGTATSEVDTDEDEIESPAEAVAAATTDDEEEIEELDLDEL
jgi:hypothetical protein